MNKYQIADKIISYLDENGKYDPRKSEKRKKYLHSTILKRYIVKPDIELIKQKKLYQQEKLNKLIFNIFN